MKKELSLWKDLHEIEITRLRSNSVKQQRELKALCAKVRNEYSTKCLKEDFLSGLKEIYRDAQESQDDDENEVSLPIDIDLPVFCISANDYLKLKG